MATIVLGALGAAAGASLGGGVLGLSSVVIGRAIGATLGRVIDQRLLGAGSAAVETGRVDRFRVTGASEGAPVADIYGRIRIGGQVIWAGPFVEHVKKSGGGKGAPPKPKTKTYSYTVSLAVALCEGQISHVGRVWADGEEIAASDLGMRVYKGDFSQLPDPAIEAEMGAGQTPAFRGTAYVVFEDLDLGPFGNRVPQLSFEVFRPAPLIEGIAPDPSWGTRGVAMIPGTGEYALATTAVHYKTGAGEVEAANTHTPLGKTDISASLDALKGELPNINSVSLVVAWFGDDLRCGECTITPRVEQKAVDGAPMPWRVSGVSRSAAQLVPMASGKALYGATPTDKSVVEAIHALKARGLSPVFNPFILMDQLPGNTLLDPWTGTSGQPTLPWRGRVTTSLAAGIVGSPDGTAAADAEVAAFFGTATPAQFSVNGTTVSYTGVGNGYRRFILQYAHLCKAAGGVDAFLLGSELRGLTRVRGATGFPAVTALKALAAEVRTILGPTTKISYGADWSEYAGYAPPGTEDLHFPLDELWADSNIDFVGIDNYVPLSDWRAGRDHADAAAGSVYSLEYLQANIEGGEGFDWYYGGEAGSATQTRLPITDEAYGEPWVWRAKDIRSWWSHEHYERLSGIRQVSPTDWQPGLKPLWLTEYGCAAIDKGANEPNRFLDVKSSESGLPRASNGRRDDFMQMQVLRAVQDYWNDPARNPVSPLYGGPMIDMNRAHVWAWDARPFPWFPNADDIWSDGGNYARGHWLNGRASSRSLASVVAEICSDAGLTAVDVSALYGVVRGFVADGTASPRSVLQTLMVAYGFDALERDGVLVFRTRGLKDAVEVDPNFLAIDAESAGDHQLIRAPEVEVAGRVRINFTEANGSYETRTAEAVFADDDAVSLSVNDLPLVLTAGDGRAIAERWLAEARVARDSLTLALPPSAVAIGAGDILSFSGAIYRIDRVEDRGLLAMQATRIEVGMMEAPNTPDVSVRPRSFVAPVPVYPVLMDLPILRDAAEPQAPYLAVTARPWPGAAAIYASSEDAGYEFERLSEDPSSLGLTASVLAAAPSGRFDRKAKLQVVLTAGELTSATRTQLLNGANVAAIGDGTTANWEILQFLNATLVAPRTYELTGLLRGQLGTDAMLPMEWPVGSHLVVLDDVVQQLDLTLSQRRLQRHYRIGPAGRHYDDPSYSHLVAAFDGVGLRPYAPAHLRAINQSGNLAISWIRRTRINGDNWDSMEVPLGETTESYRVRVMDGSAILRELTVSTPAWTYTSGAQAADGPGPRTITVAQISEIWGAGPDAQLPITI